MTRNRCGKSSFRQVILWMWPSLLLVIVNGQQWWPELANHQVGTVGTGGGVHGGDLCLLIASDQF
jgi:hypothetical protein